eukprot:TRINITY_DN16806_c1_g2_i1.p1 TRINITY_DN16806_c1_g2~~TRINITY_DN16806_c1_g2_i1.p1  ORF type:complete len:352 (+),score=80.60 TRINITY_DN16806_c1_g2_i1:23-1057(+)
MLKIAESVFSIIGLSELVTGKKVQGGSKELLIQNGAKQEYADRLTFVASFREGLAKAKEEHKFLLVLLMSADHDGNELFATSIASEEFCTVAEDEYLIWAASVHTKEGYFASWSVQANNFPFLGIIYSHTSAVKLTALEGGSVSPQKLAAQLQNCMSTAGSLLISQRADRLEKDTRRRIQEEQEAALREAERIDRENSEREKAEAERLQEERDAAEQARLEAEQEAFLERQMEEDRVAKLYEEKQRSADILGEEPPEGGENIATLSIRMLDGSQVKRRFLRSDSVETIRHVVIMHDSFDGKKDFVISNSYPIKVLDPSSTIEAEKLYPRAAVIAASQSSPSPRR